MTDRPPILDFDSSPTAIIEPSSWYEPIDDMPTRAVMTWMPDAFERLIERWPSVERRRLGLETIDNPVCEVTLDKGPVIVALASVGAPAAATLLEALVVFGSTRIVAVGSSGGLLPILAPGTVVVPDAAIRDEGVSYHYAPPARLAHPDAEIQESLRHAFQRDGHAVAAGSVWTTDAIYRETTAMVERRVAEGAVAVDMEAAALATIARFRGVRLGHAVYLADTLHGDEWDPTELIERDSEFRYRVLLTAASTCAAL